MQSLLLPPTNQAQGANNLSGTPILCVSATNVRGLIVCSAFYYWYTPAAGNILIVSMTCGTAVFNGVYDDTAAAGPGALVRTAQFNNPYQVPAGADLILNINMPTGNYRFSYAVNYRIL